MKALSLMLSLVIIISYTTTNAFLPVDNVGWVVVKDGYMWFEMNYSGIFPVLITNETLAFLRGRGWNVSISEKGIIIKRENVKIIASVVKGHECSSNSDCVVTGCSGELCIPKSNLPVNTPCVYQRWYSCFKLTKCACVNGFCTWEPNPAFNACLRENGINPANVIKLLPSKVRVFSSGPSNVTSIVIAIDTLGGCLKLTKIRTELSHALVLRGLPSDNKTISALINGERVRIQGVSSSPSESSSSSREKRSLCGPAVFVFLILLPALLRLLRKI